MVTKVTPLKTAVAQADVQKIYTENQPVYALQRFSYAGKALETGDMFMLTGGKWDSLLLQNGYFATAEVWLRLKAEREALNYQQEVLLPAEQRLRAAEAEANQAAAALDGAKARKANADKALADAQAEHNRAMEERPELLKKG
jgi:hypothetical protein